jgi:acetolactate synthase I/II/III large subunit
MTTTESREEIESTSESTQEAPSAERPGAVALGEALLASGIELVFGVAGGATRPALSGMIEVGVKHMAAKTEISAAWMSYGYNRVKRRAASACLVHEVGVLHASPAVYASKVDSTPLVLMDINLASSLDVREPLQEGLELFPALRPLSKYIRRLVTAADLPLAIRQAVISASTGRQGPSVLDIYAQVLDQVTDCPAEPLVLPNPPAAPPSVVTQALDLLRKAERPVILAGAGIHNAGAWDELRHIAELLSIPVVSTFRGGSGVMADNHPLFGGPIGSFGWTSANDLIQRADLWLTLGASFSQVSTAAWTLDKPSEVIQVDIDGGQIGKIFQPSLGIVADARMFLEQLITEASGEQGRAVLDRSEEVGRLKEEWFQAYAERIDPHAVPINQLYIVDVLNDELPDDAIVIADSGLHASFLYRGRRYKSATVSPPATPRYQSLGAGLPAAIGAKLAAPERVVVSWHGDGGFYYDFSELATLKQRGIKVITILDNNGCMLANRAGVQMMGWNPEVAEWTELPDTDFAGLAKSMGVDSERVDRPEDVRPAVRRALEASGSYLIDIRTDPDTRVKRAIPGVIPILSDRPFLNEAREKGRRAPHYNLALDAAWPKGDDQG